MNVPPMNFIQLTKQNILHTTY